MNDLSSIMVNGFDCFLTDDVMLGRLLLTTTIHEIVEIGGYVAHPLPAATFKFYMRKKCRFYTYYFYYIIVKPELLLIF